MNKAGVFFDKLKSAQELIALLKMMAKTKKWSLAILVTMIHWTGWDLYNNTNATVGGFLKESCSFVSSSYTASQVSVM